MAIDENRILKSIRKLEKFAGKAPKRPPPEKVHLLRTNARKVETSLEALALDSRKTERRLIKEIKKVHSRAGKIRDMDVLTGYLATLHLDGERDCVIQLFEHLGAERQKQAKKLRRVLVKEDGCLIKRLRKTSADVRTVLEDTGSAPKAVSEAAATALQLSSELAATEKFHRGNLHPYRLKVKRLRYLLQMADDSGDQRFVDELGRVKDAIGEWHDWEELVAITRDVLDHGEACKLVRKLKDIADSKYKIAIESAENLRNVYLRPATRKRARSAKPDSHLLASPVLAATSALTGSVRRRAA
jgi:CHAD domain-containing protein